MRRLAEALAAATEAQLSDASVLLAALQEQVEAIEREDDFALKRRIVELLVHGIVVETEGTGRRARARVRVRFAFTGQEVAEFATARSLGRPGPSVG